MADETNPPLALSLPSLSTVENVISVLEDVLGDVEKLGLIKNAGIEDALTEAVKILAELQAVLKEL